MRRPQRWLGWLVLASVAPGCGKTEPPPSAKSARTFAGTKLVVGVVGSPGLAASIKTQRGEWAAQTNGDFEVAPPSSGPAIDTAGQDVVVFPADRIGDLADRDALAVISDPALDPPPPADGPEGPAEVAGAKRSDKFALDDIIPAYRDLVTRQGRDRLALPLGGSALVVAYHKAALEAPATRDAARQAGVSLEPPRTWAEFDALARLLQGRDHNGDNQPDHGVALAWGPDEEGVGTGIWLARAATGAFHPDQFSFLLDSETTEPRVASPPFAEALEALLKLREAGPPDAATLSGKAAREQFRAGRVALLIDRAERAPEWAGAAGSGVGVWPLPGSGRVYDPSRQAWEDVNPANRPTFLLDGGGWLVGVVKTSKNPGAAFDLARHLAGADSTERLRGERGFPMLAVRASQLTRGMTSPRFAPGVDPRSWSDAVRKTLENDRIAPGLRLPGVTGYLADLEKARVAANGGAAVGPTLEALAKQWSDRTKSLGQARQTWHHRRGLPGLSTSPEPPPR